MLGGMTLTSKNVFFIPSEELKNFYLKFAYLSNPNACSVNRFPKERVRINNCVSEHLTFLTQMAMNSRTMKHLYEVYARHYTKIS